MLSVIGGVFLTILVVFSGGSSFVLWHLGTFPGRLQELLEGN